MTENENSLNIQIYLRPKSFNILRHILSNEDQNVIMTYYTLDLEKDTRREIKIKSSFNDIVKEV